MTRDCRLAIVGSGFGGSILAMIARRLGMHVTLIERGRHPRFAIGESASPLAGVLIEQLARRYNLPRLEPLASFGPWQRAYPGVVCGVKRGFTYFKHESERRYRTTDDRSNQLLVAASPSNELSDTHWLRSDVDHFLVREAEALGAEYLDCTNLASLDWDAGGRPILRGTRHGKTVDFHADAVIDAGGPGGFVSRAMNIRRTGFVGYPGTQALFSHFSGVERCDAMSDYAGTRAPAHPRTCEPQDPPFPIDDAALHHVFDGGWMWVLRFGNGVTSAGVAVTDELAAELRLADGEPAWRRVLTRFPAIASQFVGARAIREFTLMPRVAYRLGRAAGPRWAMLPSAAAFVDPLFSTGIPLTLLGIERLAAALESGAFPSRDARRSDERGRWAQEYTLTTLGEADHTARFIAGCYGAFSRFEIFTTYSMFYFAAASFSEMARRLSSSQHPRRFLCADHLEFADALRRLSPATLPDGADATEYARQVSGAVEPLNIAGLCDPSKRNWYGIDVDDAVQGAAKLGVAPDDVRALASSIFNMPSSI